MAKMNSKRIDPAALQPGDRLADGTIYAGVSPDTGRRMFTTAGRASLTMSWEAAMQYAATLDAHGHQDCRCRRGPS
jgi:hypothetical protein